MISDDSSEFIPRGGEGGQDLARPEDLLPDTLQLIPLSTRPYFPVLVQPVVVDKEPWGEGIKVVGESAQKLIALSWANAPADSVPVPEAISAVGCVARVHRVQESDDKVQFIAQGIRRFRITEWIKRTPPYLVRVAYFKPPVIEQESQIRAYAMSIINIIKELMQLNPLYNEELKQYLNYFNPNDPGPLTDFAAAITSADAQELQDVLDTLPLLERMEKVLLVIGKELEVARIQAQITEQMQEQVGEQQREFFLRQQLKVIQQELGISKDDREADAEKFLGRIKDLTLPDSARQRFDEELDKLRVLEPTSAEYGVTRNYLDWMTSVPWSRTSEDNLDLAHAVTVLQEDHEGLQDVKDRIVEFLATGAYRGEIAGSILLLVGPPGVGKTSIGRSIARALGRRFYRFSLGGMRDEAEIKGHRRTYIGAMPGKLIQALKEVETANPVIMLDEIDKIGASYQGDPASALLEVLDPEQNSEFLDHYLDLRVDLSKVLFVCTANQLDTIPAPLLDRMETIRLAGYLTDEKQAIARKHLWPRQLERAGVRSRQLKITDGALKAVIENYAREAGVRSLDKNLGRIVRKSIMRLLEDPDARINVRVGDVPELLGAALFKPGHPHVGVGVVNGLAYTALGGTTLAVEATRLAFEGRALRLTGQLGEVMQESAQIAYSYVSSHLEELGADPAFFADSPIHLHVPEGATPKDGPSAGITMATALLSLARNERIDARVAMTGELTLTGRVLPIGGVREKLVAAKRAGMRVIVLPAANQPEFKELPESVRAGLDAHFVDCYEQVADICFPRSRGTSIKR